MIGPYRYAFGAATFLAGCAAIRRADEGRAVVVKSPADLEQEAQDRPLGETSHIATGLGCGVLSQTPEQVVYRVTQAV